MIEINLVPDVKQELLRAQRVRTTVIFVSIVIAIAFAAVTTAMALYVFGGQALRSTLADGSIDSEMKKLQSVPDLGKALTIQNQLKTISSDYDKSMVDSRIFDLLSAVVPDDTTLSTISLDAEAKTITLQGQTAGGYNQLDALKKTILATNFTYASSDENKDRQSVPLTPEVDVGDTSFGQDANGSRQLRFTLSFTYPDELFSRDSLNGVVVGPQVSNATDSKLDTPSDIFKGAN